MSETLTVLIKVAERKVEEMQRKLAKTHEELVWIVEEQVRLEREAADAFIDAVGESDLLSMQAATAFQERMYREVMRLKEQEVALKIVEGEQRQELQSVYAVHKKYELLLEKQKLKIKKERAKKAQNNLDEVAGRKR